MKIKLNVRVNLTSSGQLFTIWPKSHKYLPGIEFYTGQGISTAEAIEDLLCSLPDEFVIDDEIAVKTASLEFALHRPFEIVCTDKVRIFSLAGLCLLCNQGGAVYGYDIATIREGNCLN